MYSRKYTFGKQQYSNLKKIINILTEYIDGLSTRTSFDHFHERKFDQGRHK